MKDQYKSELEALVSGSSLFMPREQMVKVQTQKNRFRIGIPFEAGWQENRVALVPESVSVLVSNGFEVLVEAEAGAKAKFTDSQFSEAGAKIVYDRKQLYQESDIIMKVGPAPIDEIEMMKPESVLFSALQAAHIPREYIEAVNQKRITGIGFEFLEDPSGSMPIMRSMSEIAGTTVIAIAAELLSSTTNGMGIIFGSVTGIPPTKVVILGAGTVAEYASRAALGLGAEVKVFDKQIYKLRRLKNEVGGHLFTSVFDRTNFADALQRADVVIGAIRNDDGNIPMVVTEEMVAQMKPNAIIIDVTIDLGGCFETSKVTTHQNPVFVKHDVLHYCVPNIASRVPRTASIALSNILAPLLLQAAESGGIDNFIFNNNWFMNSVYAYHGQLTNKILSERLHIPHKDLNLFRIARY